MAGEQKHYISPLVIYTALFIIIILGARMMSYIVNILLISLLLTLMLLPAMAWLKQRGLSDIHAVVVLTIGACLCLVILLLIILWSLGILAQDLPAYQAQLNGRLETYAAMLGTDPGSAANRIASTLDLTAIFKVLISSALQIGEAILFIFFVGVTTCFMLLEVPKIPGRLSRFRGADPEVFQQVRRMSRFIIDFMIVRTETNAIHGILFGGSLWLMGVHAAPAWGLLTFLLGYIPYIGLVVAALPAILFAFIQFGIWGAVAVIALVCVLNLIVENPVFSWLASRRIEVPPQIVILSVIFWGWLLGVPGMFFAVPITLLVLMAFQCNNDLRAINTLLGVEHIVEPEQPEAVATPPEG